VFKGSLKKFKSGNPKIVSIKAYKVLDSRGEWTIKTSVVLSDGSIGVSVIPNGASKGMREAKYLPNPEAIQNINTTLNNALKEHDPYDQQAIDSLMLDLDSSEFKSELGGNSMIAVSLAVARASALSQKIELFQYIANLYGRTDKKFSLPVPVFNILNGGKHAQNNLSFQEFMVIPALNLPFEKAYEVGVDVYSSLKGILGHEHINTGVGDEGGFAPSGFTTEKALSYIKQAVGKKYQVGKDVFFGMDVAAESFWKDGKYVISEENLSLTHTQLADYYGELVKKFELIYIEDPFFEEDLQGWEEFYKIYSKKVMVVGDDLVVTNPKYLQKVLNPKMINAVIVKPNQVGTLTETLEFVKQAKTAGLTVCVSHRSGDCAEDTFIADLAVGVGAEFMKSGAPARGERVAKYNRLLDIYHLLN